MKQSYRVEEMYGSGYGYRSGLNASMVKHLQQKIHTLEGLVKLTDSDLVIDIGSNDATSLKAYEGKHRRVGIDPTGEKFKRFYTGGLSLIPDFFSASAFHSSFPDEKAKIITSIAMFYDLERPLDFVREIEQCLSDDGIWHFEQSYMPTMLSANSYDTICHEHLEFYSFKVVKDILHTCDMRVLDVEMNDINGGSFAVTACKTNAPYQSQSATIARILEGEEKMGLDTIKPYLEFEERIRRHRDNLMSLINKLLADGKKIIGYGASTKGNVLLQFCGLTTEHIPYIAEVNEEKFGCFTPGTNIPIISEAEAKMMDPDYFFVLPWHFKDSILKREQEYRSDGGQFIFPLPEIEIV